MQHTNNKELNWIIIIIIIIYSLFNDAFSVSQTI
jgi:hypothetical protein